MYGAYIETKNTVFCFRIKKDVHTYSPTHNSLRTSFMKVSLARQCFWLEVNSKFNCAAQAKGEQRIKNEKKVWTPEKENFKIWNVGEPE